MEKYRYPGVNYFTEEDHEIFRGRKDETRRLFRRLLINKTMVLHSESGIGKSSLIRAGLIPYIEVYNASIEKDNKIETRKQRKVLPVTVRGISTADEKNDQNKTLIVDEVIRVTLQQVEKYIDTDLKDLPIIKKELSLWYLVKQIEFAGYNVLFIFDQFEEIQSYSYEQVNYYEEELSTLFLSHIPEEIDNQIDTYISDSKQEEEPSLKLLGKLESQLSTSCLFVIREDRLSVMSRFTNRFPDILKNNFYLRGLDTEGAKDAIVHPASLSGSFKSPKFEFNPKAVDKLIANLINKDTERIAPIQVQIICKSLEETIIGRDNKIIEEDDISSITNIIADFYKKIWNEVTEKLDIDQQEKYRIRKEVISKLVSSGKRVPVLKGRYSNELIPSKVIDSLEQKGFLRKLTTTKGIFYELSHDRLIDPISDDMIFLLAEEEKEKERKKREEERRVRREQRKKREEELAKKRKINQWIRLGIFLAILIFFLLLFAYKSKVNDKKLQQQVSTTIHFIKRENPAFAYFLAKNYPINNNEFDQIIEEFHNSEVIIPTQMIPLDSTFISASYSKNKDSLTILEANSSTIWQSNTRRAVVKELRKHRILKSVPTEEYGNVSLVKISDKLLGIYNSQGTLLYKIKGKFEYIRTTRLALSKDLKYLYSNRELYDVEKNKLIVDLYDDRNYYYSGISSIKFLNNSNYLAVRLYNGEIIIYHIKPSDRRNPLWVSKFFRYSEGDNYANRVRSYIFDSKDSLLIISNLRGHVYKYRIDSLDQSKIIRTKKDLEAIQENNDDKLIGSNLNTTGIPIGEIVLSDSDSLLLGTTRSGKGILWDIKNDTMIDDFSTIPGMSIHDAGFLSEDTFYTVEHKDRLCIWTLNNDKKGTGLFKFSRFYFREADLKDIKKLNEIYGSKTVQERYLNLSDYLTSFPRRNVYKGDKTYKELLRESFQEIETQYNILTNEDEYKTFEKPTRFLLSKRFLEFKYELQPRLIPKEKEVSDDEDFRESIYQIKETNNLLEMYFELDLAKNNVSILSSIFDINYFNFFLLNQPTKITSKKTIEKKQLEISSDQNMPQNEKLDWNKAKTVFREYERMIYIFKRQKEVDSINYGVRTKTQMSKLAQYANKYSFQALLDKKYDQAIFMSQLPLLWDEKSWQIAEKNLALGYLLNDRWEEAEKIYRKWNNKFFDSESEMLADDLFIKDIVKLRKAGITDDNFDKVLKILKD